MKYDTATPYTASYVILKKDGKVAFVLRQNTNWMNGHYGLPSGKIEKGEAAVAAAVREVQEEVGVTIKSQDLILILTGDRHEEIDWVDFVFEARQWEGKPYNAEPHMHAELAWLDPHNLPKNVIPSVRFYLEQIQAGRNYAPYGWHE